jgi:hypothetical protein
VRASRRFTAALLLACVLGGCSRAPTVALRPDPPGHSWWLRLDFQPRGRLLRGVAARAIQPTWCAIEEFGPAMFAAFDDAGPDAPAARYAVAGPSVDGRPTVLVLAAYRACTGDTGTAMVLLDVERVPARVLSVERLAAPAAYAMLDVPAPGRVRVVFCQHCDHFADYAWVGPERRFLTVPDASPVDR